MFLKNYVMNIEMEIDTSDSPPITERSYTLPLKHAT